MSTQRTASERLDFLRNYVKILDSQFTFPGSQFKFGIDPLLNIIPGFGSYSGMILGMIFIVFAHMQGVSGKVKVLMFRNSIIDFLLGSLPVAGYITDFFYKSNEKNLRLLEEHILDEKHCGSGWSLILLFIFICLVIFFLALAFFIWLLNYILSLL
jgi:hypothetical protein